LTHKELKSLYKNYVHTTNLEHKNAKLGFLSTEKIYTKCLLTKKGDILLSRVGKIGKMSMVWKGKVPISDCIYCIRVPKKYRRLVWKSFTSKNGENWFNAYAHGVCAKLISKKDLLNFPIKII
jgi:type I restriction enzyme M protein